MLMVWVSKANLLLSWKSTVTQYVSEAYVNIRAEQDGCRQQQVLALGQDTKMPLPLSWEKEQRKHM